MMPFTQCLSLLRWAYYGQNDGLNVHNATHRAHCKKAVLCCHILAYHLTWRWCGWVVHFADMVLSRISIAEVRRTELIYINNPPGMGFPTARPNQCAIRAIRHCWFTYSHSSYWGCCIQVKMRSRFKLIVVTHRLKLTRFHRWCFLWTVFVDNPPHQKHEFLWYWYTGLLI